MAASFKGPGGADSSKWVTDIYFGTDWQKLDSLRKPLPVALDLGRLYEQLLRELMPVQSRRRESIAEQVERVAAIRSKQSEAAKLTARLKREKQFNRKVEINAQLRSLRKQIDVLSSAASLASK